MCICPERPAGVIGSHELPLGNVCARGQSQSPVFTVPTLPAKDHCVSLSPMILVIACDNIKGKRAWPPIHSSSS